MAIINLRDYYPFYTSDCFMEVSEEVAEMFKEFDRKEAAYRLRTYRHKAYYSLDRDDGLEHEALFVALSPHELYATELLCTPGNICDITMGCSDGCTGPCQPGEPSETHSYCGAACR